MTTKPLLRNGKPVVTVSKPEIRVVAKSKLNGKPVPRTCGQPSGKVERWMCCAISGPATRTTNLGLEVYGQSSCVVEAASWFEARSQAEMALGLQRGEVEVRREDG